MKAPVIASSCLLAAFLAGHTCGELATLERYDPIGGGRIPAHPPGTYERWRAQIAECIERLR